MENREGKGKTKKKATGRRNVGGLGGVGLVPGGSVPAGCGSPGRLLLGKLRQGAGSPRGAGCTVLPTAAPRAQGLSPRPGRVWPLLAWGGPQRWGTRRGGSPHSAAASAPAGHRRHASTATAPAPRPRWHRDHAGTAQPLPAATFGDFASL